MKLKRGQFGHYELPAFACGCEYPYISEYDEERNCFLVTLNVAVSRWYPEDVLRRIFSRFYVEDIDGTIEELKNNIKRGNFEKSDYPSYSVKCPLRCDSQFVRCELCDTAVLTT